jgi:hypothetical protein
MSTPKTAYSLATQKHILEKHYYLEVPSLAIGKSLEVWGFSNNGLNLVKFFINKFSFLIGSTIGFKDLLREVFVGR